MRAHTHTGPSPTLIRTSETPPPIKVRPVSLPITTPHEDPQAAEEAIAGEHIYGGFGGGRWCPRRRGDGSGGGGEEDDGPAAAGGGGLDPRAGARLRPGGLRRAEDDRPAGERDGGGGDRGDQGAAALRAAAGDAFAEYQAEVRAAVESRGYYEVDGNYLAVRAQRQARLEEDWAELFADFELSDCEEDNQEEEEEEDTGIQLKPTADEHHS